MSKVAGKRYTYKFDFNGLMQACQQLTAVTSAETLAMSSSSAGLHLAYVHHGGQISPMLPSSHSTATVQQGARESGRIHHHSMRYPINQAHQYQWLPTQHGAHVTVPDTTPTTWNLSPQAGPSTSSQQISQDNPTPVTSPYNYHK